MKTRRVPTLLALCILGGLPLLGATAASPGLAAPAEEDDGMHTTEEGEWVDWQGMPLTPQTQGDYPSHAMERFDLAKITGQDPRLDGMLTDAVWNSITPHAVPLYAAGNPQGDPVGMVNVRAFHNGQIIYWSFEWQDATYNDSQAAWLWNDKTHKYGASTEIEDSLVVLLKTYGDFYGNRHRGNGYGADEWRWGAALTNPSGYAEDRWRLLLRTSESGLTQTKVPGEDGRAMYESSMVDAGRLCYQLLAAPKKYDGDRVMNFETREPQHSAGDVRARANYAAGGWTLEMARHLNTYAEDDLELPLNGRIDLSFSVQDGAGGLQVSPVYAIRLLG